MWILLAAAVLAQDPSSEAWEEPVSSEQDSASQDLQDVLDQALGGTTKEAELLTPELPAPTWEALIERAPLTFATQIEQPLVVGQEEADWAPGPDLVLLPDGSCLLYTSPSPRDS